MDWIGIIGAILGGIGLGQIATQYLSARENKKELIFNKKEECYLGLISAMHQSAFTPSEKDSKNFAFWMARIYLVGSPKVIKHVQEMVDTNSKGKESEREAAYEGLRNSMREDLNIDKRRIK